METQDGSYIAMSAGTTTSNGIVVTSGGDVGIGTTSPSVALEIYGDSGGDEMALKYSGTAGAHASKYLFKDFRGQSNAGIYNHLENDGVGTAAARLEFHTATGGTMTKRMTIGSDGKIGIGDITNDVGLANLGSGTAYNVGTKGIYWNCSEASKYTAQFRNGADPAWGIAVKLGISAPDTSDKYIDFIDDQGTIQASFTGTGHATAGLGIQTGGTEAMRIDESGYVGIGTDDPDCPLHVSVASGDAATFQGGAVSNGEMVSTGIKINSSSAISTGEYLGITFSGNVASLTRPRAGIGMKSTGGTSGGELVFMTRYAADGSTLTSSDVKMTIRDNGKVGINNTSASAWLDIGTSAHTSLGSAGHCGIKIGSTTGAPAIGNLCQITTAFSNNSYGAVAFGSRSYGITGYGTDAFFVATRSATTDTAPTERFCINPDGKVGFGTVPTKAFEWKKDFPGHIARFHNDGNTVGRYGIICQIGTDDNSGTNYHHIMADGDGGEMGFITSSSGTVSYGAFTAHHDAELPDADNENGYPYGTLVETTEIFYQKRKDDTEYERGIRYKVQKTSSAYSKSVLGAYSNKHENLLDEEALYQDGDELPEGKSIGDVKTEAVFADRENLHLVGILGDGHILCNGETGNISVGDGICASSAEGQGMKADKMAMIIGIAQEDVTFSGNESKLVVVQYGLQQFMPWDE